MPGVAPWGAGTGTDDGRRRVAAELRRLGSALCQGKKSRITIDDLRRVLFARPCPGTTADRLADLIEPSNGFDFDTVQRVCFERMEGCDEPEWTLYTSIYDAIARYKRGESGCTTL